MRSSISPGERLEATLLFLANGSSYSALKFLTRISQPSLSAIIPETCTAIYEALKSEYLKVSLTLGLFAILSGTIAFKIILKYVGAKLCSSLFIVVVLFRNNSVDTW